MKIQAHLARLVLASLLPAVIAVALLIAYSYERQKQAVQENTLAIARALSQAVDRELASGRTALQALATSPHLASGDLAAFHAQARMALPETPGSTIVLSDSSGQQLVNTLRNFGEPLSPHGNPKIQRVIQNAKPSVSDLFFGKVAGRQLISIDVPVRLNGRVAYVLSMGFFPEHLGDILKRQQLPEGWIGAIFDSQGALAARTHNPERYLGKKGAPGLMEGLAQQRREGGLDANTLEGIPAHIVFSRSGVSNWVVAIAIPRAEFESQLRSSLLWMVAGTMVLVALGLVLARLRAARIRTAIRRLIQPAEALAGGKAVMVRRPLDLAEAAEVAGALERASHVLRDREEILAVVAHDLRSPLMTMKMLAGVTESQARKLESDKLLSAASLMKETTRGMAGLVDDLLMITVSGRSKSMLKPVRVNAGDVLAKAVQSASPQIEHALLKLEIDSPQDLPEIEVDIDRIVRVFHNLLDNALKFTDRHGRVLIAAQAWSDNWVRFSVANSGPALPQEQLDVMFRPFWQAEPDRRGAGLGLSICRAIVDTHGGCIWAQAQDGMRVRFCIELPRAGTALATAVRPIEAEEA